MLLKWKLTDIVKDMRFDVLHQTQDIFNNLKNSPYWCAIQEKRTYQKLDVFLN